VAERESAHYDLLDARPATASAVGAWLRAHAGPLGRHPDAVEPGTEATLSAAEFEALFDIAGRTSAATGRRPRPLPAALPTGEELGTRRAISPTPRRP